MKASASHRQILDGARKFLSGWIEFDNSAPMRGDAGRLVYDQPFPKKISLRTLRRALRSIIRVCLNFRFSRQHVCSRALAGLTDVRIALHIAHNWVRRYGDVHHSRSALRANRIGIGRTRR
jgi:hypothetical protein